MDVVRWVMGSIKRGHPERGRGHSELVGLFRSFVRGLDYAGVAMRPAQ